ncbi:Putative thiol:disulfide oxidoreductase involved in cytochrome C-type biogenesis [Methanosarcina horonobensis HB-1 = JCM 15518]|uniref:Putative thiol:disulfide oxidoreductase involved in cytochrome C-type biogenesis n=1 Tax=Methanosarcina horonobensis HB-1 = JCM 15518 TaxID=1434110 RepID=A0A0E3WTY9_9EURY|nr:thioredoxin family protein [Methanosarcina horonobensis]AKB76890.1 Putative thiol:disulfide oxidoreductase involved in cytochrome C-type biogenesis [Methanosarcina horonobensis HB-1 = JCM 15518]
MKKLVILLILLAAVLFTAGCTEDSENGINEISPDFRDAQEETQEISVVENMTDLAQINASVQEGPVFVKIGSERCGPCRQMKPILSDLAAEYTGKATVMSGDIDQSPQIAVYFGINYIPDSFVIVGIENGEYVYMREDGSVTTDRFQARIMGLREKQVYEELLDRAILYHENVNAE